jgi:F-box/WD-40 domain protein MET30
MCLQFSENLSHPSFPVLITGSYDRTVRVWNMETGAALLCLKGHTRGIRALQFDECKLITGSMDRSIRVWDWRSGKCVSTLMGHTEGVVCLNFDSNVLASGSVDATVKVWNLRTGKAFTLRGHRDWVNSVRLWDSDSPASAAVVVVSKCGLFNSATQIDPGKMLFSASDDGTIRLWDLTLRTCVRQFIGHVGQVQSIKLLALDEGCGEDESQDRPGSTYTSEEPVSRADDDDDEPPSPPTLSPNSVVPRTCESSPSGSQTAEDTGHSETQPTTSSLHRRRKTVLISGSLDNTAKMWDIDTGKTVRTLFGHIEGVWALAADKLRLVTGSQDRTIKVKIS